MTAQLTAQSGDVRLTASASLDRDRLRIDYSLRNQSLDTIYVFNKLHRSIDPRGVWTVIPDRVYVIPDLRTGSVTLSKRVLRVPEDLDVEKPEVPLASKLESGKSLHEQISQPVPLTPHSPYQRPVEGDPKTVMADLYWEIGFFHGHAGTSDLARVVETTEGPALRFSPFNPSSQLILRVGPYPFQVPVRVPSD